MKLTYTRLTVIITRRTSKAICIRRPDSVNEEWIAYSLIFGPDAITAETAPIFSTLTIGIVSWKAKNIQFGD